MKLSEMKAPVGATRKSKRKGRGYGSGLGKTAGRGMKGQNSRSGGGVRLGFEGGQMPLYRRIPKRGFTNIWRKEYAVINLADLNRFDEDAVITPELLLESGVINKLNCGLKVLGGGELEKKITVKAHKFSKTASEKIEAAGGKAEVI